jgi:hypothetical protein
MHVGTQELIAVPVTGSHQAVRPDAREIKCFGVVACVSGSNFFMQWYRLDF